MKRSKIRCVILLFILTALLIMQTADPVAVFAAEKPVYKTFEQLTEDEKQRVLESLMEKGIAPDRIKVGGGTYSLNESLWYSEGIIAYGITANVNAANQTTGSPNYKNGQYRYWGYDVNGGLYGNDNFPRDSDSGTAAYNKDWLTITQIRANQTAANYIGKFAMQAGFSRAEKLNTASVFLDENPAWRRAGIDEDYILEHFYFNSVLSDSGLTRGQFIGVHMSRYDNKLYYQTFSVKGEVVLYEVPPAAPEEPAPPDPEEPEPLPSEPGMDVSVEAELFLPPVTYVGHPALAEDYSVFWVDGEPWSAARAYSEGKADNRFTSAGGSVKRISDTRATVTYSAPGDYDVTLRVTPKGGSAVYDTKSIEVLDTPAIIHNLTGPLKQNRKNTIHISVAKNPGVDLTTLWVKLEHPATGESVTLHHKMGAGVNSSAEGQTIKARAIEALASDSYFINCRLEFLTKNTENTDYRLTIYAEEKNGKSDLAVQDFSVAQDKPPEANIFLESCYIRNEASNKAEIIAEDGTVTDGDQVERTWYYRETDAAEWIPVAAMEGYTDYSFGSGKKISFLKEGVGPFEMKLVARDVWVEETLSEYITESDYLSAETICSSEIINVAPVVSLSPITPKTANVTILAGGEAEYDRIKANLSLLEQELLRQRVDAHITLEKMTPAASEPEGNAAKRTMTASTPFGYEGEWTFYDYGNYIVDNERLYKIDASWPNTDSKGYPEPPYTISCWDAASGNKLWTYTFTDELLPVPRKSGPCFAQDDTGRYLYFVASGKTLVLTKDTGSFLTLLNMEIGRNCFVEGDFIYTIKTNGIYRISALSGRTDKIYNGNIMDGVCRRLEGKIHFVTGNGQSMFRGLFDPENEKVELEPIAFESQEFGLPAHKLLGVDVDGNLIVNTVTQKRASNGDLDDTYITRTRVYGRDNRLLFAAPGMSFSSSPKCTATPVYDEGGHCNYIVYTWEKSSSKSYTYYAYLYGVRNGYVKQASMSGSKELTVSNRVPFARELNGQVYVCNGAYWVYVYNMGYGIYPQRLKVFVFDPEKNTVKSGNYYNELGIPLSTIENGYSSDVFAAVQAGYNTPGAGESLTYVLKWDQSLPQIINRYVSKHFKGGKDINVLILYDETNDPEMYGESLLMDSLRSQVEGKNGKLILADRALVEESRLGEAILEAGGREKNLLGVSVEGEQAGSIAKTYNLEPNQTYYYEYEIKRADGVPEDSLEISHLTGAQPGAQYASAGYRTAESYYEDFEDKETNPFFTLALNCISEGYYKGANLYQKTSKNSYGYHPSNANSTKITFTVPEGKLGFLSFDYLLQKRYEYGDGASNWTQSYVKIDGQLWRACVPNSGTGHYSHPELLQPGVHELTFFASEYGKEIWAKMWLDNIRVDILEQAEGNVPRAVQPESVSVESLTGGYVSVKGSFKTLPEVASYGEVENATVIDGKIGTAPYTVWTNTDPDRKAFDFQIPSGKTAIYTLVSTQSKPRWSNDRNYSVTYRLPLYYKNKEDGWIYHKWISLAKNKNSQDAMHNVPTNHKFNPGELEGTKTFSLTASSYRQTSGDFTNITSVIVDSGNKSWGEKDYFLTGLGGNIKFFLQKEMYNGTELTFRLPEGNNFIRNLKLYTIRDGIKVYVEDEAFSDSVALTAWAAHNANTAVIQELPVEKEEKGLVYKLNELVQYGIDYYDYEADPSKKQYWRYTHTPFNLGPHPDAAVILDDTGEVVSVTGTVLNEPIQRFSVDGKYTVEHWQEDNTSRPVVPEGNPDYDKPSNVETLTFYVEGSGSGPWIESIGTLPKTVREGNSYRIQVFVNDAEKDELRLTTELYKDRTLIFAQSHTEIRVDASGNYPPVVTDVVPIPAEIGKYEVVCTVRDQTGVGMANYSFVVVSDGKITGRVYHTDEWEKNRKKYNVSLFGEEFNKKVTYEEYISMNAPRKRGTNVFWSGERFMLSAEVGGMTAKVSVSIPGTGYQTLLTSTGTKNAQGETIYRGELWDSTMLNRWGKNKAEQLTFRFTAVYEGGAEKIFEETVIVDSTMDYWLLHRLW